MDHRISANVSPVFHNTKEKLETNATQGPILRVIPGGGQTAVALFFVFTGYGSSLSAFSKLQQGGQEVMLSSIAKGALARPFRIILPTAILTTIAWFLCQLNAYAITQRTDASWIRDQYVAPSPSFWRAISDLVHAQVDTWTKGYDVYDQNQVCIVILQFPIYIYSERQTNPHKVDANLPPPSKHGSLPLPARHLLRNPNSPPPNPSTLLPLRLALRRRPQNNKLPPRHAPRRPPRLPRLVGALLPPSPYRRMHDPPRPAPIFIP